MNIILFIGIIVAGACSTIFPSSLWIVMLVLSTVYTILVITDAVLQFKVEELNQQITANKIHGDINKINTTIEELTNEMTKLKLMSGRGV